MQQYIVQMPTASGPSMYKTEPAASSQSPLHVKWSGMPDAIHPYMAMPIPAAAAGAFVPPNDPWMYANSAAMPQPTPFAYQPAPYAHQPLPYGPVAAPYAVMADPFPPLAPFAPLPPAMPVAAGAYGGCGCGGRTSGLPYASPIVTDAAVSRSDDNAAQVKGAASAATSAEPADALPVAAVLPGEFGTKPRKSKSKTRSRSDSLRELLRRKGTGRKQTPRRSRPWMID